MSRSIEQRRKDLHARLRKRQGEIEEAIRTRVFGVAGSPGALDPEHAGGLRAAVRIALDHALLSIGLGEERLPSLPQELRAQARAAARSGVGLDTVLRRYVAGQALLADFLVEEANSAGLKGRHLRGLLREQAALVDRSLAVVSEEHASEAQVRPSSVEQLAQRVERLLAGELLDTSRLAYDFDCHHLGAISRGPEAADAIRSLESPALRPLIVPRSGAVWAWFGSRQSIDPRDVAGRAVVPPGVSLAFGEPGQGLSGWRLTHRQARATLSVAVRRVESIVHYADIALLAAISQDDLLATSLRKLYLAPLRRERDGGAVARETLCAYFAAERNISSAAVSIGVTRRTVANRLRAIEQHLGCSLSNRAAELEAAMRLHDLDQTGSQADCST